jgi:hypothetical protein
VPALEAALPLALGWSLQFGVSHEIYLQYLFWNASDAR